MLAASFKRTKIVATIGPASSSPQVLEELLLAGVNCFRLNFSHGTQAEHAAVAKSARALSNRHAKPVAIIADLSGPKIRVGSLPADGLPFVRDHKVRFEYGADYDTNGVIPVQFDISGHVKPGERIYLRDGQIQVVVEKIQKKLITATVRAPGLLYSNQGINLPDTDLAGDILTPKDLDDLKFAAGLDVDYVALSFVQTADDIEALRRHLHRLDCDARIVVKIETAAALQHLEDIVIATDVIMVARGDLAVETKPEAVPAVQRRLVELSKLHRKTVIVATQMLESMIQSPHPTRAEVSDVATAVLEGADAVMLSGETAVGLFPVDTVKMMKRVILYTEREELPNLPAQPINIGPHERVNAISAAAVVLARRLPAKVIIAETSSGQTARNIAALRPGVPIIMVTNNRRVYQQLPIVWGGKSYFVKSMTGATEHVIRELKSAGNVAKGDSLVVASGHQPGLVGGTDTVSVKVVE